MDSDEKHDDFGHFLQLHRHSKAMSLQEISELTKIPVSILKLMENEDLAHLPATVFVKGFVRAYAAVVGADVTEALLRFDACCAVQLPDHPPQQVVVAPKEGSTRIRRRLLLAITILIVVIGVASIALYRRSMLDLSPTMPLEPASGPGADGTRTDITSPPGSNETSIDVSASAHSEPEPDQPAGSQVVKPEFDTAAVQNGQAPETDMATAGKAEAAPVVEPNPSASMQKGLSLQINASEATWLQVTVDNDTPKEMTLKPGELVTLTAEKHFKLLIGNAGGVSLRLNDRLIGVPGKSGKVVTLQLP